MAANLLSWQSEATTLRLSGVLDRETLLPLWQQRASLLAEKSTLDVAGLERVDSAGLALLVNLVGQQQQQGKPLQLAGVSQQLNTLIGLYNLEPLLALDGQA